MVYVENFTLDGPALQIRCILIIGAMLTIHCIIMHDDENNVERFLNAAPYAHPYTTYIGCFHAHIPFDALDYPY